MLVITVYFVIVATLFLLVVRRPAAAIIMSTNIFTLKQWSGATSVILANLPLLTNLIAGSLVLLGVLLHFFRGNIRTPLFPKEALLTLLLYLYVLLTIIWAPNYSVSMNNWLAGLPYIITMIFLAPLTIQETDDFHCVFLGMLVLGTLLASLLLFTVEWEGRRIVLGRTIYGDSIGGNPLTVGLLGGTLVILAALYRFPRKNLLINILKISALIIGVALAIRSGSRGQVVGMLLVVGLLWSTVNPSRSLFKPILGVLIITILIVIAKFSIDLYWQETSRFDAHTMQGDYVGRLQGALLLLEHWSKSPFSMLFGLGSSASYNILGIYPHIVPLEILGEEGMVGFIIFCAIIVGTVVNAFKTFRLIGADRELRSLFVCILGLWLYSFLLINKQGSLLLAQDFFFYTILLTQFEHFLALKKQEKKI